MASSSCPKVGVVGIDVTADVRTLYVVDLENIVGCSEIAVKDVAVAQRRIEAAVPSRRGDHVVIATSHHNGAAMMYGWDGSAERKVLSGQDGADRALVESIEDVEWLAKRYQRVVIASGDHFFAFALLRLKNAGIDTILVPPDVGCSRALRKAAGAKIVPLGSAHPIRSIFQSLAIPKDAA